MGFVRDGFALTFRGRGELDRREEYLLREGVPGLVPLFFFREDLEWVFVYDLQGGYSLGDLEARGEGLVGVGVFVSILERIEFLVSEYFLVLEGFFLGVEEVVFVPGEGVPGSGSLPGRVGLVYCPLFRGDFWGVFLSLFGSYFRGESWFGEYLTGLEGLGGSFSLSSFLVLVRSFVVCVPLSGGVGVGLLDDPEVRVERRRRVGWFSLSSFVLDWLEGAGVGSLVVVGGVVFLVGVVWGLI